MRKVCAICGQEFEAKTNNQKFCLRVVNRKCAVCGAEFEVKCGGYDKQCCSAKCTKAYMKQYFMKTYGVENPAQLQASQEKAKQTCLARYGTEHYTQTEAYKTSVKQTSLEKYGTEHFLKAQSVKDKRVKTNLEKYGTENAAQSAEVKQHIKQTYHDKYGVENISQLDEVQNKIRDNNIAQYGVAHPMMLSEYKNKAIQTNIEKYGRRAYTQQHIKNIQAWYSFIEDPRRYIQEHYSVSPRTEDLAEDLGVDQSTVGLYLGRNAAFDCVIQATSKMELAVESLIRSLVPDAKVCVHDRHTIWPQELDISLPDYKLAIECNPTATHNSSFEDPWGGEPKTHSYHRRKSKACEEKGYFLFHIFGYEWTHKREIIESMLRNLLHCNDTKIYGRDCTVQVVESKECLAFLNHNHRQGYVASPINLGLYYGDELVSLMTFGHARHTIGKIKNTKHTYELVRFCSKLNTTVVGGANKLFQHFLRKYKPTSITSFSDIAHTRGLLYEQLGFHKVRESEANYLWVDIASDKAYHRANVQKSRIARFLKDYDLDDSDSEKHIMEIHNFAQVFDSGTITWEWRSQK